MSPTANSPRLLIRSSAIHAAGCYTLDPIRRGARVIEYDGPRLSKRAADDRYADRDITYLFGVGDTGTVIDGFCTAMFLNHSCDPNCETVQANDRIFIQATRDIAAGEELVYEYNLYDSDDDNADCHCGAPHCRGTMFSDAEVARRAKIAKRNASKGYAT
ncbi:MAG: SET domain-containing protein-lysine N-methyltransferase [Acidobacteriota bacterium]|nr:SET domain-containing protein-lysine N-methyltransferase [Acidobacteriota bacterium]